MILLAFFPRPPEEPPRSFAISSQRSAVMKTLVRETPKKAPMDEALLRLQLQVAQRADELAHARGASVAPSDDYECWLQAERDVLGSRRPLPGME